MTLTAERSGKIPRAFQPPPPTSPFPSKSWLLDRLRSSIIVFPASFVLGLLTSLGQSGLPSWLSSIANSSGGWSAAVFGLIWLSRFRPLAAIAAGIISFGLLNLGYATMSSIRGFTASLHIGSLFLILGFVIGPIIGVAAAWMRSRSVWLVSIATAALPTILVGEGIYGLIRIGDSTSPVYWTLSICVGAGLLALAGATRQRAVLPIALSAGLTAAGSALFYVAYSAA